MKARVLLLAWVLAACTVDGSLGSDVTNTRARDDAGLEMPAGNGGHAASENGSHAGSGGHAQGGSTGSAHGGSAGDAHGGSAGDTHGGSAGDAHGGSAGETQDVPPVDAGAHPHCEPSAADTSCTTCQKERCCEAFETCTQHEPCVCVSACLAPGVHVEDCETHCEVMALAELEALTECAIAECSEPCQ